MKKIVSLLLAVLMLLTSVVMFASCGTTEKKAKVIDIALSEEQYAFAVSKTDAELLGKVNEYLEKIKADGTFDDICNHYFGDGTPVKYESKALNEANKAGQLIVATSTGFEPFEMVDQNGLFYGIDLEIAAGLAAFLGKELVIQDMKFESVVTSVETGICNIGMAGLTITPKRQEQVTFSNSYYSANQVLIVKESDTTFDNCKTVDDVVAILNAMDSSKKAGCQAGTTGEIYITGDADDPDGYGFAGLHVTKMAYDYGALAVTAMLNGQIDFVVLDDAPAKAIVATKNK